MRKRKATTAGLLFLVWQEAADKWLRLRSDPALRACLNARSAYYLATMGEVPKVKQ